MCSLVISIIDACRCKTEMTAKGFKIGVPFSLKLDSPTGIHGVVTRKSSNSGEASQESSKLPGAVFTHYFLTALKRAGDRSIRFKDRMGHQDCGTSSCSNG